MSIGAVGLAGNLHTVLSALQALHGRDKPGLQHIKRSSAKQNGVRKDPEEEMNGS